MALPPRLIPFPWEDIFLPLDMTIPWGTRFVDINAFVNNERNTGATLCCNISDSQWTDFSPGINTPDDFAQQANWPTHIVAGAGVGGVSCWDARVDLDVTPAFEAANKTTDQWWTHWATGVLTGATPATGLHTYPGCLATQSYGGYGRLNAVWKNRPIWSEVWFEENPDRPDPLWGFNGYTVFGDQGNCEVNATDTAPADLWRRRFVMGVLKRTANMATCGPEDVMIGVILTSDGTTTTMQLCCNGAVMHTSSSPTVYGWHAYPDDSWDSGWAGFESAWDGPASDVEVWPGFVDKFQATVNQAEGWYRLSQFSNPGNPLWIKVAGYDTYDVKWGWYVDDTSATHPVDTPYDAGLGAGKLTYSADQITISALHGELPPPPVYDFWTQAVDSTESAATIVIPAIPGAFATNALALNPAIYIDFEDFVPTIGVGGVVPCTPAVLTLGTTAPCDYYYDETTTVQADGPVGKAMSDMTGWWAGAEVFLTQAATESVFVSGLTLVFVSNPWSDPLAAAGYTDVDMSFNATLDYTVPALQLRGIECDISNMVTENATSGVILLRLTVFDLVGGWQSFAVSIPDQPLSFFDGNYHVFVLTAEPNGLDTGFILTLYVDGSSFATGTPVAPSALTINTGTVSVTAVMDFNSGSGSIDEGVLYDRVLSPAEIATLTI